MDALQATGTLRGATHARWYDAKHEVSYYGCPGSPSCGNTATFKLKETLDHSGCVATVAGYLPASGASSVRAVLQPVRSPDTAGTTRTAPLLRP